MSGLGSTVIFPTTALFISIVFLYSKFNLRRTEDCTHALWNLVLFGLCKNEFDRFLPTPQYHIWVTKADCNEGDANESQRSTDDNEDDDAQSTENPPESLTDGGNGSIHGSEDDDVQSSENSLASPISQGNVSFSSVALSKEKIDVVIPDYVLLMPQVYLHPSFTLPKIPRLIPDFVPESVTNSFESLLKRLNVTFPIWKTTRVSRLSIPLIVELKRPIPRRRKQRSLHIQHVDSRLSDAMDQVEAQAMCLFKARKHQHQDDVILIAATADYWRFRRMRRPATFAFDRNHYINLGNVDEANRDEDEDELEDRPNRNKSTAGAEDDNLEESDDDFEYGPDSESDSSEGEPCAEEIKDAQVKFATANKGRASTFIPDELNKVKGLKDQVAILTKRYHTPLSGMGGNNVWIAVNSLRLDDAMVGYDEWSPIFQIGTPGSDNALQYISGNLRNRAANNGLVCESVITHP